MKEGSESWSRNSINKGPEGGRTLKDYERLLKFKKEDLENKFVLDLGAGPKARFAKELERSGIKATVISLSPDYADTEHRELFKPAGLEKLITILKREKGKDKLEIAGIGEELPFKDGSFDEILALWSISEWAEHTYERWIPEIYRVLKQGGVARIGPYHPRWDTYDGDIFIRKHKEMKDVVKGLGFPYEFIPGAESGQEILVIHKIPEERGNAERPRESEKTANSHSGLDVDRKNTSIYNGNVHQDELDGP